jgi:putative membrane protein
MRTIGRIILATIANVVGILAASYLIAGFVFDGTWQDMAILALALTGLNFILKPILKFFLGPLIILSLGFGLIAINAFMLYLLDFYFETLSIQSVPDLLYAALVIGGINFIFHLFIP